jgi:hypothetical protein
VQSTNLGNSSLLNVSTCIAPFLGDKARVFSDEKIRNSSERLSALLFGKEGLENRDSAYLTSIMSSGGSSSAQLKSGLLDPQILNEIYDIYLESIL